MSMQGYIYEQRGKTLIPEIKSDKHSEMQTYHHLYNSHFTPVVWRPE